MFDPRNPNPSVPDGMASITSAPAPGLSGGTKPARPGMPQMPSTLPTYNPVIPTKGTEIAQGMGAPVGQPTPPQAPVVSGGGNGAGMFGNMFSNLPGGLGGYLGNYMNSLFSWLNSRPQDHTGLDAWRAQRPVFSGQDMRAAMFAPTPAPAPVAGIAEGEPVPGLGL